MTDNTKLTLDRLFNSDDFKLKPFGPVRWLDNDAGYTTLEPAANDEKVKEIARYAIPSGERTVLVTAVQLQPPDTDQPLIIKDYDWSPDKTRLLIFTNTKRVWRLNTRGDYWVLDLENGRLSQLGSNAPESSLMFAKFAPDGQSVAYVRQNNIYVEEISNGAITQLTHDGSEHIINGTSDWAYEEEFKLRDGFCWSPDGQRIAYWQFDTTGIETFYMINNTDSLYPKLIPLPYPKVGTTNAACRVGVVGTSGGETNWFDVPGDSRQHYIPKMEWAASSEQVVIQQLNRLQNQNKLLLGNAANGTTQPILTETDDAWVDLHNDLKWLDDGSAFTWVSERDGWRHLYRVRRDGQEVRLLTPGDYDVISVEKIDSASGWVYFIASPDNPTQRYLYRVGLNGNGRPQRLTPAHQPGSHSYQISPQANWAFHTYSTIDSPPIVSLVSLPKHEQVRILEANESLRNHVDTPILSSTEFFQVEIEEGVMLDGWCMKPPDFDPAKKYPLLFYLYGEPANVTVVDRWINQRHLYHRLLTQHGFVVMSLDNRGTPAPRGRKWRKMVYRQVGILGPDDQTKALKQVLAKRPYLDPNRVGVWGWSGGGSMTLNLLFKYPDIYKTGIAVAAVSDQRYYDTIYQERYMGLPADNEEGFKNGSPITFAHQLQGNLLMIHGTGDDNVHYQAFEAVVNALIKHNKQFSMMAYPNRSHGMREGENTSRHLHELMLNYLLANL
ncbi:MAG: S9 family peptidase [Ardenticatenaceae bacterium]|nr:S9 family peptidase [Ardenticatenaceae bacterium]MCB9445458.1 S9 family peptidase [Ardenticatenaceae bacterium]